MSSSAKKDPKTGKWMIQYRFTDWRGIRKKSTKRGLYKRKQRVVAKICLHNKVILTCYWRFIDVILFKI